MEILTLQALLESDREMLEANLAKDRSPAAAQTALEKEIDRIIYRCLEQYPDEATRSAAQYILQTMKNTLPLMDAVGEAREWQTTLASDAKKKPRPAALIFLFVGILLILATVLALHFGGRGFSLTLSLLRAVIPAVGGMAALVWAGVLFGRPVKKKKTPAPESRTEFLIDTEKVWRLLHAAMMLADNMLSTVRDEAVAARQKQEAEGSGALSAAEIELFSELLESAYALRDGDRDEDAREMIASIRFFLHGSEVDVIDMEKGREAWFEFLPASAGGTLRPALATGNRLLKKGLASA